MTDPIEKDTLETLLSMWKEVKKALDKAKLDGKIEELKTWLENADHKTFTQYNVIRSLMAKIESMQASSHEGEQQ